MNDFEDDSIYVGEGEDEHVNCLVGTPEGLKHLREHIDRALAEGKSEISAEAIEWDGVARIERAPEEEPWTWRSRLLVFGCSSIVVLCVFLMLLGVGRLKDMLTK